MSDETDDLRAEAAMTEPNDEPMWRYAVVVDMAKNLYTVLDRQTGQAILTTHEAAVARRMQELAEQRHRQEQERLDALARASGRPR